jgi:hypothetical protein
MGGGGLKVKMLQASWKVLAALEQMLRRFITCSATCQIRLGSPDVTVQGYSCRCCGVNCGSSDYQEKVVIPLDR